MDSSAHLSNSLKIWPWSDLDLDFSLTLTLTSNVIVILQAIKEIWSPNFSHLTLLWPWLWPHDLQNLNLVKFCLLFSRYRANNAKKCIFQHVGPTVTLNFDHKTVIPKVAVFILFPKCTSAESLVKIFTVLFKILLHTDSQTEVQSKYVMPPVSGRA